MLLDTNVLSETMRPEPAWQVPAWLDGLGQHPVYVSSVTHAPHYARILASRQKAGKRIATEDAQIAAIACSRRYSLATRNVSDFGGIAGLEIVNPWGAV